MKNNPSLQINQALFNELLKLQKMACTARQFLEAPPPELQDAWDGVTSSYVREIEQIILDLEVQSVEALWLMSKGGEQ